MKLHFGTDGKIRAACESCYALVYVGESKPVAEMALVLHVEDGCEPIEVLAGGESL